MKIEQSTKFGKKKNCCVQSIIQERKRKNEIEVKKEKLY